MIRPLDWAALALMSLAGCSANESLVVPSLVTDCVGVAPETVRVASYNVKSGMETTLDQVRDTIEQMSPDVVALEEIDVNEERTGNVDQPRVLAERLGYQYAYAATINRSGGTYGIALLSRLPFHVVERMNLRSPFSYEPRVAIDAIVCAGDVPLRVIAMHADILTPSANVEAIAKRLDGHVNAGTIVMGDFNATNDAAGIKTLKDVGLHDLLAEIHEGPTFWPSNRRIDYLFADPILKKHAVGADIGTSKASDHFPVWADFNLAHGL